jgi:hypothetical protein
MKEEMDSLVNNQTWDLVQFPTRKRALQNKWVYKLKEKLSSYSISIGLQA